MAILNETWAMFYPVGGESTSSATITDGPSETWILQGSWNFSKLWLYLRVWSHEWEFVLKQLHSKLEGWLMFLRNTQHMGNLWVERHAWVDLQPYDTIASDNIRISKLIPEYHLSDFASLWLAIKALIRLIDLIERKADMSGRHDDDPIKQRFNQVRRTFEDFQNTLGDDVIRSNVLKTFTPKGDTSSEFRASRKAVKDPKGNMLNAPLPATHAGAFKGAPALEEPVPETINPIPEPQANEPVRQTLIFKRTVDELVFTIQPKDVAIIEAASASFFEGLDGHIWSAWQEALNPQLEKYVRTLQDPQQVALILFATKCGYISTGSPEGDIEQACCDRLTMAVYDSGQLAESITESDYTCWSDLNYEPISLLIGSLFKECRFILYVYNALLFDPLKDLRATWQEPLLMKCLGFRTLARNIMDHCKIRRCHRPHSDVNRAPTSKARSRCPCKSALCRSWLGRMLST